MDQFDKVERIASKTGVSFEEAKNALEENNWDMLDAMLALEKKKSAEAKEKKFSTNYESQPGYKSVEINTQIHTKKKKSLGEKIKNLLIKSHINHLVIRKGDRMNICLPLWLAAILVIRFWTLSLILLVVGLICGCKISFEGPDMSKAEGVNNVMDTAGQAMSKTAKDLKNSFSEGYNKSKNQGQKAAAEDTEVKTTAAADTVRENAPQETSGENAAPEADVIEKTVNGKTAGQFENEDFNEVYKVFSSNNSVTTDDGKITLEL